MPFLPTTFAEIPNVDTPATAAELPANVNVHTAAPDEVIEAALQVAVKPLGNPETILMLDPDAAAGIATPPTGVAVKVAIVEASDCMVIEEGATLKCTEGAYCNCNVAFTDEVNPSPAAVITMLLFATAAVEVAVRVSVSLLLLDAPAIGFALHWAVTPVGKPLIENVILPLNDPPVAAFKLTALEAPCAIVTTSGLVAAVKLSVACGVTVSE